MLRRDHPIEWRAARLTEMGLGVGLWNWPDHDLDKLEAVGPTRDPNADVPDVLFIFAP